MKLKGFTLIEVMITLGLAGLVVGLGMLVYRSMSSMHLRYEMRVEQSWDKAMFEARVEADMKRTYAIKEDPWEGICLLNRDEEPMVCYAFEDSVLLRKVHDRIDTMLTGQSVAECKLIFKAKIERERLPYGYEKYKTKW